MGIVTKGILLFNTIKYLKLGQIVNQIFIRIRPKESIWKYKKKCVYFDEYCLWINSLDNNSVLMERFIPSKLLENEVTLLCESRVFDKWFFEDESHLWNFNLHYLEYLIPMMSSWKNTGDNRYRKKINDILMDWYENGSKENDSNQPYTISLRVVNQLIVCEAVDDKQRLYDSIYAQYKYLINHQEKHLLGNHYLENLKAIVICSIVFNEEDVFETYIKKLLKELKEQITEDGLHFELSPMYHKIILEDLIRIACILEQAKKKELKEIVYYISKMCSALYSLEYGADTTPLFNDAGDNVAKPTKILIDTCKELFDVIPKKMNAISGYHKIYDGKIALVFDCGEFSPSYMPGHAHCDCLSFELYYDGIPVFVNSGTYQYQGNRRSYFRSTKAHNTVMINEHEQSELWGEHRAGRRITNIISHRNGQSIVGEYSNYFGEYHKRSLLLENGVLYIKDFTNGDTKSYLHLSPGLLYKDGVITGNGLELKVDPINTIVTKCKTDYSPWFGKKEESECLIFSWKKNDKEHGYRISIKEKIND